MEKFSIAIGNFIDNKKEYDNHVDNDHLSSKDNRRNLDILKKRYGVSAKILDGMFDYLKVANDLISKLANN